MDEPAEDILSIKPGEVTVKATVTYKYAHRIRNGNLMTDASIADRTGTAKAVWFSKHPKEDLVVGSEYIFSGDYKLKYGRLALQSPKYQATCETPPLGELAQSPLILPERNYPAKASFGFRFPDWLGGALVWTLIIGGIIFWIYSSNHHAPSITSPRGNGAVTGSHNNIPEIHSPGIAESNSNCSDVTSYDYDWDDDVLCTRPDGSQFYTNYAGGDAADSNFHE